MLIKCCQSILSFDNLYAVLIWKISIFLDNRLIILLTKIQMTSINVSFKTVTPWGDKEFMPLCNCSHLQLRYLPQLLVFFVHYWCLVWSAITQLGKAKIILPIAFKHEHWIIFCYNFFMRLVPGLTHLLQPRSPDL